MEAVQRSAEWHESRLGKFTSSEIHKLMGIKGLGLTGEGYAFDKAVESFLGIAEENFVTYDMQMGIELEPLAFNKFSEIMDLQFIKVDNCGFIEFTDYTGSSPDGLVDDNSVLEIKCPKASTFFKLVADGKIDDKYFYQMQHQMMCTGRQKAYLFNYYILDGVEYHHTIEVLRDEEVLDKMRKRISEAVKIRDQYISKLNNNKQF